MSERRNAKTPTTPTVQDGGRRQLDFQLRRSPRLLSRKPPDPSTADRNLTSDFKGSGSKSLKEQAGSGESSLVLCVSASGSIESSTPSSGLAGNSTLRRSPRLSLLGSCTREVESNENGRKNRSCAGEGLVLGLKADRGLSVCGNVKESRVTGKRERKDDGCKREEGRVVRRRSGREKDNKRKECVNGWTREQELALQGAYFSEKPTPHFWKKVAKLVPGKSAQDCFDKVHSDNATPPQPPRRSRAKKSTSPIGSLQLSACKILDPCGQKTKRCNKRQKHQIAHKTVRQMLQKHNCSDHGDEADLFSILEPNTIPSAQDSDLNLLPSTPKNLHKQKLVSLENLSGRSSSGHKKSLSRFSSSRQPDIVSPPVLKQVKDRFLHEKYIDRLHCRETKRQAAASRLSKSTGGKGKGKENIEVQAHTIHNVDVIAAAKNALSFDARDAIDQLRHLESGANSDVSDLSGDAFNDEDD